MRGAGGAACTGQHTAGAGAGGAGFLATVTTAHVNTLTNMVNARITTDVAKMQMAVMFIGLS